MCEEIRLIDSLHFPSLKLTVLLTSAGEHVRWSYHTQIKTMEVWCCSQHFKSDYGNAKDRNIKITTLGCPYSVATFGLYAFRLPFLKKCLDYGWGLWGS